MKQLSHRQSLDMAALVGGLSTKSEKIRALAQAGFQQSDIGRFLKIRPQFVSNVVRAERGKKVVDLPEQSLVKAEQKMSAVVEGLDTKSAKIRALDKAGFSRSQIAKFLDIRYQHVRNVLVQDAQVADASPRDVGSMKEWIQVAPDGRVVLPVAFRKALGVEGGGKLLLRNDGAKVQMLSQAVAVKELQDWFAKFVPKGVSLVDELIAERRAEQAREDAK